MKRSRKLLIVLGGLLVAVVLLFWFAIFMATGAFYIAFDDGEVISKKYNVCLHTEPNNGSGDWDNIFTYYCDQKINWNSRSYMFIEDYIKNGALDMTSSGECVSVRIKEGDEESRILTFKPISVCALFDKHGEAKSFVVNQKGEFIEIQ